MFTIRYWCKHRSGFVSGRSKQRKKNVISQSRCKKGRNFKIVNFSRIVRCYGGCKERRKNNVSSQGRRRVGDIKTNCCVGMAVAGAGHHHQLIATSMAPAHTINSINLSLSNSQEINKSCGKKEKINYWLLKRKCLHLKSSKVNSQVKRDPRKIILIHPWKS